MEKEREKTENQKSVAHKSQEKMGSYCFMATESLV